MTERMPSKQDLALICRLGPSGEYHSQFVREKCQLPVAGFLIAGLGYVLQDSRFDPEAGRCNSLCVLDMRAALSTISVSRHQQPDVSALTLPCFVLCVSVAGWSRAARFSNISDRSKSPCCSLWSKHLGR